MARALPVVGGVRDGDHLSIPANAEEVYQVRLTNNDQFTDYTLRVDGKDRVIVATNLKWPLFDAVGV